MSETEPITFSPHTAGNYRGHQTASAQASEAPRCATFTRQELTAILAVYGRKSEAATWSHAFRARNRCHSLNVARNQMVCYNVLLATSLHGRRAADGGLSVPRWP